MPDGRNPLTPFPTCLQQLARNFPCGGGRRMAAFKLESAIRAPGELRCFEGRVLAWISAGKPPAHHLRFCKALSRTGTGAAIRLLHATALPLQQAALQV